MTKAEQQRRLSRYHLTCEREEIKKTVARGEIFRYLAGTESHPDAQTVFKAVRKSLPRISLDTVYRALWLFRDLGLLRTIESPQGRVTFDSNLGDHHHFICNRCGTAYDFTSREFQGLSIPKTARALGQVLEARVELRGICRRCDSAIGSRTDKTKTQTVNQ